MNLRPLPWLLLLASCGDGSEADAAKARAAAKKEWALTLKVDGADVRVPLEVMNVLLIKRGDDPEIFEILGPGVALVGEFPAGVKVDYEEKWSNLFGKTVELKTTGGDPREPKNAVLTLPGKPELKVLGGSFVAEKFTGKWDGSEGDKTLRGRIRIRVQIDGGEKTLEGTFAVNAVTWG